ncbi:MAG: hypothetical protein GYA56_01080 [Geobacteraceae bacterium]|nr:hypothetical protein [Geobacteraceae bacterium]
MWLIFASAAAAVEVFVLVSMWNSIEGGKRLRKLREKFWRSYAAFCGVFPLAALAILLLFGVHPSGACEAAGALTIVNGIFVGIFVEIEKAG